MRLATAVIVIGIALASGRAPSAHACPRTARAASCFTLDGLTFDHVGHALTVIPVADVAATGATGGDFTVDAAAGVGATYVATFGRGGAPAYQVAASLGAMVRRLSGAVDATGAGTHAELRLGPALVADGDAQNRRSNTVSVPLTFELSHDGELAALPRLSARPDVARARYGWQHVGVATRALRVEMEGGVTHGTRAVGPGARAPIPMTFDLLAFHADLDLTRQDDGQRVDGALGGALLEVAAHGALSNFHVVFLELDHRRVTLPDDQSATVDTVWMLRADLTSPRTGGRYHLGWGAIVDIPAAPRSSATSTSTTASSTSAASAGGTTARGAASAGSTSARRTSRWPRSRRSKTAGRSRPTAPARSTSAPRPTSRAPGAGSPTPGSATPAAALRSTPIAGSPTSTSRWPPSWAAASTARSTAARRSWASPARPRSRSAPPPITPGAGEHSPCAPPRRLVSWRSAHRAGDAPAVFFVGRARPPRGGGGELVS